jgi:tetratricopeptide (TPR) repeat protein
MIRFKGVLLLGAVLAGLGLNGLSWAASRAEDLRTEIRVNQEARTLSVVTRDRVLDVAVIPAADRDNPVIDISGWDLNGRYRVAVSDTAPVIFIDLYEVLPGFNTAVLPVDMGWVTHLRIGHHPDRVRIALDGRHPDLPRAGAVRRNGGLVITLETEKKLDTEKKEVKASGGLKPMPQISGIPAMNQIQPAEKVPDPDEKQRSETVSVLRQSMEDITDPDAPDSRLFQESLVLFDNRQWAMARNKVQQIMSRYPQGPYAEKARFLLTDILTALYADDPAAHYRELTERFQDVLNRYPDSPYRGRALLGLARLHRDMGNHAEALAYYELARNSAPDENGLIVQQAMLDTAKIHQSTGRINQALVLLEDLLAETDIPEIRNETLLETAKIRYEQGFFNESLNLLTQLISRDNRFYFQNPDVSLYFGNNCFQLGRHDRAVNHLLHYYNAVPKKPGKEMTLARVGDAFLQGGRVMDAVRCFQFVVDRYPDTRAAAIGWLRLAEQKEKDPENRIPLSYSAKQIYEKIRDVHQGGPINDSLALLAVLKLAVLYHDEKRYDDSLETLTLFFQNNPDRSLLENGRFALKNVLEAMIQKAYEEKDYETVISLYTREARPVIPLMEPDPVLLTVARAYRHSGNSAAALELYHTLAAALPLDKAPDDVLFFTGKALYETSRPDTAEERLSQLIRAYPKSPYAGEAMVLMGRILAARGKFREAVAMMTRALSHPLPPCERASLLVETGRAALADQDMETTRSILENARKAIDHCPALAGYLGDQIGDLYVKAGDFDKAASIFTQVLDMADSQVETAFLQYKAAVNLWRAGNRDAGQALFEILAAQDNPFWSRLAREHLAAARFDQAVR